jgi:hypothetical protein
VSSFTSTSWFTGTNDVSAFIVVQGDLTIQASVVFIPTPRKLFTVLYVMGNLNVQGILSMAGRGASHASVTAQNILVATGTHGGVTNPSIPAAGGAGGTSGYGNNAPVNSSGGTGGGGGGGNYNYFTYFGGAGAAGTCFSGGSGGGGGSFTANGLAATANGGAGGNGDSGGNPSARLYEGGVGNPAGSSFGQNSVAQNVGTGGTLIVICLGTITIGSSGAILADGVNAVTIPTTGPGGSTQYGTGGGPSGGGMIVALYGNLSNSGTLRAAGGKVNGGGGHDTYGAFGGDASDGTVTSLVL